MNRYLGRMRLGGIVSVAVSELLILSIKAGLGFVAIGQVARLIQNVLWRRKKRTVKFNVLEPYIVSTQIDAVYGGSQAYRMSPRVEPEVFHGS